MKGVSSMLNRFLPIVMIIGISLIMINPQVVFAETQENGVMHHDTPHLNFFDFSMEDSHPLVALAFNFITLVIIVYLLMRKPLGNRFKQRKEDLEKALAEAKSAKERAEAVIESARAKSDAIDDEMAKLREEIISSAKKESAAIVVRAESQAKRLLADTESLVAHEISMLAENLREEIVVDVIKKATEEIQRQISDADHQRLAADYLSGVKQTANDTVKH